ncbi:MAG: ABC transporter ATP-binding protein [Planctomycetota bacterium]|jgi:ABC-type Fe3+/spermidine/putrescine transport system ATPase subunit|nr:ABC transporter ATP-binding protein [Planctomycetota bacterium]MDP6762406.1 ABC transporter ATP-binding protein [Planctomycetota bacterium]MDP6989542.1 ABC transporter ATP-binding protein [Planctomycetota bacterium]
MTRAIELESLTVRAGGRELLGPLDLAVERGEHVLVVGPSGSGKTTLLRAICGLARPHSGRVLLFGERVSDGPRLLVPPAGRGVGMLFQGGALWPHMSVRRTLEFVLARAGTPRAEHRRRTGELLELVHLEGFEDRLPSTLSGGEAQRLALARALAPHPRLLLLDEPLGPLDSELRASLLARLAEVQRSLELTVLHVTHDPGEANSLADRTLVMAEGAFVAGEERKA